MTTERIKEIQSKTAYPESVSVQQALLQVWRECEQEQLQMNKLNTPTDSNNVLVDSDFWVECNVCKTRLKNWTGSTPCCGSIAWLVEDGKPTKKLSLFTSVGGEPIKPTVVNVGG